jgi:hypothetical protein
MVIEGRSSNTPFVVYIHHRENGWPSWMPVQRLNSFGKVPIHLETKPLLVLQDSRLDDRRAGSSLPK